MYQHNRNYKIAFIKLFYSESHVDETFFHFMLFVQDIINYLVLISYSMTQKHKLGIASGRSKGELLSKISSLKLIIIQNIFLTSYGIAKVYQN